jgi:hypothetical protein
MRPRRAHRLDQIGPVPTRASWRDALIALWPTRMARELLLQPLQDDG